MSKKTTRISTDELSAFAAQATERALEARKTIGVELNQEELDLVGGGALNLAALGKIVYPGGPFINPILNVQLKGFTTGF